MEFNRLPIPLDMNQPQSDSEIEDELRRMKEVRRKREEKEKLEEIKKKQIENEKKKKQRIIDPKKNKMTYDYNGLPIMIKTFKTDNLPKPFLYIQHGIKDIGNEKQIKKEINKLKEVPPLPSKQNQIVLDKPQIFYESDIQVPTYDLFQPQKGVTYTENGVTKCSFKEHGNFSLLTNPSNAIKSTLGENLRLSKSEYQQLVQNMSPSLHKILNKEHPTIAKISENINSQTNLDNIKTSEKKFKRSVNSKQTGTEIFYNPIYMPTLLQGNDENISSETYLRPLESTSQKKTEFSQKCLIEKYNSECLNSKDREKNPTSRSINSLHKLPRLQTQVEKTIGKRSKYPRKRANHTPVFNNYSRMLIDTLKNQQIS